MKTTKTKTNTICVRHHYTQTYTNNVYKPSYKVQEINTTEHLFMLLKS